MPNLAGRMAVAIRTKLSVQIQKEGKSSLFNESSKQSSFNKNPTSPLKNIKNSFAASIINIMANKDSSDGEESAVGINLHEGTAKE